MNLHAVYLRLDIEELQELQENPARLQGLALATEIRGGRALDLGRGWDQLGCLLDGGISIPESGPAVGDVPIASFDDGVLYNAVLPDAVRSYSEGILGHSRDIFLAAFLDEADTADGLPDERTGQFDNQSAYLLGKFELLAALYREATKRGQAILIRLGPERREARRAAPEEELEEELDDELDETPKTDLDVRSETSEPPPAL